MSSFSYLLITTVVCKYVFYGAWTSVKQWFGKKIIFSKLLSIAIPRQCVLYTYVRLLYHNNNNDYKSKFLNFK